MSKNLSFNIFGGYGKGLFPQFDTQETVNLYVETEKAQQNKIAYYPTDGLVLAHRFSKSGRGRALHQFADKLVAVCGAEIYLIDEVLSENDLGTINTDSGLVDISSSDKEMLIVDGANGWLYNRETGVFRLQTQPAFPKLPRSTVFFSDRFVAGYGETNEINYSEINNGLLWYGDAEFKLPFGEKVIGLATILGQSKLYVFGKYITQIWYDAGAPPPLPFRKELTDIPFGCVAPRSLAKDTGLGFIGWLTQSKQGVNSVAITDGGKINLVSSPAIEREFENYSKVDDATGFIYKNSLGHIFYQINFPTENKSWQFRINSELPYRDRWVRLTYKANERDLAEKHTYYNGKHYVIDYSDNALYERSINYYSADGIEINRNITTPTFRLPNNDNFICSFLKLRINVGESLDGFKETDAFHGDTKPFIYLRVSHDGGLTYGKTILADIGKIGDYLKEVKFYNLGYGNQITFKIDYWNKTKFGIFDAFIGIVLGDA